MGDTHKYQPHSLARTPALIANVVVASAYFLFAGLALAFAIPPDFFAPFFMPAGIALAVCVSYGRRLLPGLMLGALTFNLFTFLYFKSSEQVWLAVLGALAISSGSVLQAWIGAQLFARFSGSRLSSGQDIISFLLLVPASCLIAASVGIGSLAALGQIAVGNGWTNWLIWWFGDTVGALLGSLMVWILVGLPRPLWQQRRWTLGVSLLLTSFAFLVLYANVRGWEDERKYYAFERNAQQVSDLLQFQFEEHERILFLVAQAIAESDTMSPEKFARLSHAYLENRPELRLMSFARHVTRDQRPGFEAWAQANVIPGFAIRPFAPVGATPLIAAEYYATIYIEPLHGNQLILGLDLLSEPIRADMVRRAVLSKRVAASALIQLAQTPQGAPGILLAQALDFRAAASGDSGILVAVIETEPYLGKTLARAGFSGYTLKLVEINSAPLPIARVEKKWRFGPQRSFQSSISLGQRHYQLTIQDPSAQQVLTEWGSWAILTTGLLLTAMLGAFLLLLSGQREQTESFNRELSATLEKLESTQEKLVQSAKLAALGAMVAGIAHELNTPLGNSMLAASELEHSTEEFARAIEDGIKRSVLLSYVEKTKTGCALVVRNLRRAAELVNNFKQVAVHHNTEHKQSFSLATLVDATSLTLQNTLDKTGVRLSIGIAGDLRLHSYPAALSQVLLALFENALVHAFEGRAGGQIQIKAQLTGASADWLKLSFEDDGDGIPPSILPRIFDPFFTTRMGSGNLGLGLAIAHNVVAALLGGYLEVTSELGHGTSFTLYLPLEAP